MKSPVTYDPQTKTWTYRLGKFTVKGFKSADECAKKYVEHFLRLQPKYKELLKGKTWPEIYRVLGVEL